MGYEPAPYYQNTTYYKKDSDNLFNLLDIEMSVKVKVVFFISFLMDVLPKGPIFLLRDQTGKTI